MGRCRANMAHLRQSSPNSCLGSEVKGLKPFYVVPSSLESGGRGPKAGSYLRLIEFVYQSTLGLRVIKKKKVRGGGRTAHGSTWS